MRPAPKLRDGDAAQLVVIRDPASMLDGAVYYLADIEAQRAAAERMGKEFVWVPTGDTEPWRYDTAINCAVWDPERPKIRGFMCIRAGKGRGCYPV